MDRAGTAAVVGSLVVAVVVWGAVSPAAAQDQSQALKKLMGENFAGLQTILVSLITSSYGAVPEQVKLIEDHAQQLTQMVPESAESERARFLSYAYNLRTHAQDLESIVRALMEHDEGKQQLATDALREAAAAHYGGMVTMCVSCHNRFRQNVVR
jgi:cytochrome c556